MHSAKCRREVCRFFNTPARCRHGANCQFSRETSDTDPQRSVQEDEFRKWLYQIPPGKEFRKRVPLVTIYRHS